MLRMVWLSWWLWAATYAAAAEPFVEFVHISDSHIMNLAGVHPKVVTAREHYNGAGVVLERVLTGLARSPATAFVLHTGDIVDAYCFDGLSAGAVYGQIESFKRFIDRSPVPVFLALGNHDLQRYRASEKGAAGDFSVAADARREWRAVFPVLRGGTYYSFRKHAGRTTYRFLVLDNGEPQEKNPEFYSQQLKWIREQVDAVKQDRVILAMHIPLRDDPASAAIRDIASRAGNVVLAIGGHKHNDAVEEIDTGAGTLVQVRTAILATSQEHTRRFRLFEDRIEIAETGQPERLMKVVPVAEGAATTMKRVTDLHNPCNHNETVINSLPDRRLLQEFLSEGFRAQTKPSVSVQSFR